MNSVASEFDYDLFISYSTRSDYRLARQLESFLESFHRTRTGRTAGLSTLQVCLDGSDFGSAVEQASSFDGAEPAPTKVPQEIERHLNRSRRLLILCSPESMQSPWVRSEIRFFLKRQGAGRILLALTHGATAEQTPEQFFAPELIAAGLSESVWYDFRGFHRQERHWPTLRDFDSERLRLLANLHGKAASSLEPFWIREQHRAARTRTVVSVAVAILTMALSGAAYVQRRVAQEEKARAAVETSLRHLAQAYRHRFTDPFTAVVEAHESARHPEALRAGGATVPAMAEIHQVLIERRGIALQERKVRKPGGFSFVSQASSGQRFTKLSPNGERVLVVTERGDQLYSAELKGDAYLLDNRSLGITQLVCSKPTSATDRLEFAGFVGSNNVVVARGFYLDLYTADGGPLGGFQLLHAKTPITAVGGMLSGGSIVAGNGAGCVCVGVPGKQAFVEPSPELSAVTNCDDERSTNALVQILTDPTEHFALNLFQSGRVDLFGLDGPGGRPKRRSVLKKGGHAVVFRPGVGAPSFALAYADATDGSPRLSRWDVVNNQPQRVGAFAVGLGDAPIDFLGCSQHGDYLIGLDTNRTLQVWHYETRAPVMTRTASDLTSR